jgi:hypothetical protein
MSGFVVTPELIEQHRQRAHKLRAEALRVTFGQIARAARRLFGAQGAGRPATAP